MTVTGFAWFALCGALFAGGCDAERPAPPQGRVAEVASALVLGPNASWRAYASSEPEVLGADHVAGPHGLIVGGHHTGGGVIQFYDGQFIKPGYAWMHHPRTRHAMTTLTNGDLLVTGGEEGHVVSNASRLTKPANAGGLVWEHHLHMAVARQWHTSTLLSNGRVLLVGGDDGLNNAIGSAEIYDPGVPQPFSEPSFSWLPAASLGDARRWHTATLLANGKVLVAGGDAGGALASAEIYDPAGDTWSATGSMSEARRRHTATALSDGRVLVVGGDGQSGPLASAEIYDPVSGSWAPAAPMTEARTRHRVLALSGQVIATGGDGLSGTLASVESYDVASDAWSLWPSLNSPRAAHVMTMTDQGWIVVAAGEAGGSPVSGVERLLFDNLSQGEGCASDSGCDSGFCVAGVCCDKRCNLECNTCAPNIGVCAPANDGASCAACGSTGLCSAGACAATSIACHVSFVACDRQTGGCDTNGLCFVQTVPDDAHLIPFGPWYETCHNGHFYANGSNPLGAPCSSVGPMPACAAGAYCAPQLVCCDQPCTGPDETCSIAGGSPDDGLCVTREGRPCDDHDDCTTGDFFHNGVCAGTPSVTCTTPDAGGGAAIDAGNANDAGNGGAAIDAGNANDAGNGGAAIDAGTANDAGTGGAAIDAGTANDAGTGGAAIDAGHANDAGNGGAALDAGIGGSSSSSSSGSGFTTTAGTGGGAGSGGSTSTPSGQYMPAGGACDCGVAAGGEHGIPSRRWGAWVAGLLALGLRRRRRS